MRFYGFLIFLFTCLTLISCDGQDGQKGLQSGEPIAGSLYKGLAFTGVDPEFGSSDGYFYDYKSGVIRKIAWAQGGDPMITWLNNSLFFFNRRQDQKNYFPLKSDGQGPGVSEAITFKTLADGSPQKVHRLKNGNFLVTELAMTSATGGGVFQINPLDGSLTGKSLRFNVPDGQPFHPVDLRAVDVGGVSYIFITHKGIHITLQPSFTTRVNGSQAVFALRDGEKELEVLNGGNPVARPLASDPQFLNQGQSGIWTGGLCDTYPKEGTCVQAFEMFDPVAVVQGGQVLSNPVQIPNADLDLLGGLSQGFSDSSVLTSVNHPKSDGGTEKIIAKIDLLPASGTYEIVKLHEFPADYLGGYLFMTDPSAAVLFFGERDTAKEHFYLRYLSENGELKSVTLDRIPYNGDFDRI